MPTEHKERNKDIVQLFKVGFPRPIICRTFNMDKRNLKRLAMRDWDKYPQPTLDELKVIEEKYHLKVGELKVVNKPEIIKRTYAEKVQ